MNTTLDDARLTCGIQPTHPSIAELERLGDEIAALSAHLDAASARLLDLIREFDARGGWGNGFKSCAHWLTWRIGLDRGAAREKVRVARALGALPRLANALARGELSYSKVRALTRAATPETEERLLKVGRAGTAEHSERIVRGWRRVDLIAEAKQSAQRHRSRALRVYQDEDGMVVIHGRLEPETGAVLMKALEAAREALDQRARAGVTDKNVPAETFQDPAADPPAFGQQQADARAAGAPASRPRLSLPGLRIALRPGPSHPPLGPWRPHDAVEPGSALSAPPPHGPRRRLPGRTAAGWSAPLQAAGRAVTARRSTVPCSASEPGGHAASAERRTRSSYRPHVVAWLAGRASRRRLRDRRLASAGDLQ